jgi:protease-4
MVVSVIGRVWRRGERVEEGTYVLLDLEGGYSEDVADDALVRLMGGERLSVLDLLLLIRDAGEDPRVEGLVVRLRPLSIGWAKAQEIRDALLRFRATGKPLHAMLELEFGGSMLEYYVASAAQHLHVPPGAAAPLTGLLAEFVFLGGVWEKLDIDMQVLKIREYKTAGDMLANKEMSPWHREMAEALLDSMYAQVVDGIATQRGQDPAAVRKAIDAGPATPDELQAAKLIDDAQFLDQLRVGLVGADGKFLDAEDYAQARHPRHGPTADRRIAVVFGTGTVTSGESESSPGGGESTMGADSLVEAFREAGHDDSIGAIVFRIDSPGGSALASDLIWRAVRDAVALKPVVVSMSDVAASGGYYAAAGASRILAQPGTLTGSIGVVLAKPNIEGFLAKLGVHTAELRRGSMATMMSLTESFSAAELSRVNATMEYIYDLFVARVAEGRKLDKPQVNEVGRGRVWTGAQAQEKGLVDELGGFLAGINAAKAAVGIPVEQRAELVFFPRRRSLVERLSDLLATRVNEAAPPWWRYIRRATTVWRFPAGSILTLMPSEIVIR